MAFLLVLVAVPVCAALVVSIGVLSVYTLAVGDPVSAGEAAQAAIFFFGPLAVVGYSIYATTRAETSRPVLASLLVFGGVAGAAAGGWFGWGIVVEKRASMAARVLEACSWGDFADCEARAEGCVRAVGSVELPVHRGLDASDRVEYPDPVPNTPEGHALYRCLAEGP
ncbi:MAG: hypothetical protein RLO52_12095 [Sandaracinaceae bacterium]|nr:MAG: hypothetical protein EVA89_22360 [Sandaracinaceae bacterium]